MEPENIENGEEVECGHFTMRGCVYKKREKVGNKYWPFVTNNNYNCIEAQFRKLPDMNVPKFAWWRCKNCVRIYLRKNVDKKNDLQNISDDNENSPTSAQGDALNGNPLTQAHGDGQNENPPTTNGETHNQNPPTPAQEKALNEISLIQARGDTENENPHTPYGDALNQNPHTPAQGDAINDNSTTQGQGDAQNENPSTPYGDALNQNSPTLAYEGAIDENSLTSTHKDAQNENLPTPCHGDAPIQLFVPSHSSEEKIFQERRDDVSANKNLPSCVVDMVRVESLVVQHASEEENVDESNCSRGTLQRRKVVEGLWIEVSDCAESMRNVISYENNNETSENVWDHSRENSRKRKGKKVQKYKSLKEILSKLDRTIDEPTNETSTEFPASEGVRKTIQEIDLNRSPNSQILIEVNSGEVILDRKGKRKILQYDEEGSFNENDEIIITSSKNDSDLLQVEASSSVVGLQNECFSVQFTSGNVQNVLPQAVGETIIAQVEGGSSTFHHIEMFKENDSGEMEVMAFLEKLRHDKLVAESGNVNHSLNCLSQYFDFPSELLTKIARGCKYDKNPVGQLELVISNNTLTNDLTGNVIEPQKGVRSKKTDHARTKEGVFENVNPCENVQVGKMSQSVSASQLSFTEDPAIRSAIHARLDLNQPEIASECTLNKNPTDFSLPQAGNPYMIGCRELKRKRPFTRKKDKVKGST